MANRLGYSAKDAAELQKSFTEEFAEKLISESSITVPNFGTFEVKKKKERIIVNQRADACSAKTRGRLQTLSFGENKIQKIKNE